MGNDRIEIEIYQQDWIPGFAAFRNDSSIAEGKAHVILNVGAFLAVVANKDVAPGDLPYCIAESLMHEVVHVFEAWAQVEFSEDRVEALIQKYRDAMSEAEPLR